MPHQPRRIGRSARTAVLAVLLPFALIAVGYGQPYEAPCDRGPGGGCGPGGDWGPGGGCPAPVPVLELEPGWSLYWYDPCRCSELPCAPQTCPDSRAPVWYVISEFMPLFRDQLEGDNYQANSQTKYAVLRESDLRTEFDAGGRYLIGRTLGDWYRLEGSYFGSYGWDDSAPVWSDDPNDQGGIGNLASPFGNFGIPADIAGLDNNNFASVRLSSELDNVELNLRRRVPIPAYDCQFQRASNCCYRGTAISRQIRMESSFLVGVRYLRLDEQFGYETRSSVPAGVGSNNFIDLTTSNEMIGAQIGWTLQMLLYRRSWFDVEMKGGIFQNSMSLNSSYRRTDSVNNELESYAGGDSADRTSFVNELSVVFNHQITPRITFRAGYNAFWIWQAALASQNLGNEIDRLAGPVVPLRHDGDVVYHGPSLGLAWAW